MATSNQKGKSHLGFFLAMLVVAAVGGAAVWYVNGQLSTSVDQQATEAANPPRPMHPKKDEAKVVPTAGAAEKPAGEAPAAPK